MGSLVAGTQRVLAWVLGDGLLRTAKLFRPVGNFNDVPCNGRRRDICQDVIVNILRLAEAAESLVQSQDPPQPIFTCTADLGQSTRTTT